MSARAVHLVIDARPRGPHGLLAAETVLGKSVLQHLLDLAVEHVPAGDAVVVHARGDEHDRLRELTRGSSTAVAEFVNGPPRADAAILRTDRLYDPARLRRGLRRGRSPESAVIWRLDRPESLLAADQELTRRLSYQPLGKYWAFPMARRIAERLCPTSITPNAVTLASGSLMLWAAALVAVGPSDWIGQVTVGLSLALALVLDTADGRLARLQGTSSAFGRWLDQVLDELADLALHAAIAWAAFSRDGRPIWLLVGIIYASGKYLFLIQSLLGDELEGSKNNPATFIGPFRQTPESSLGRRFLDRLTGLVRLIGHADIRWHLWIVLAFTGRLDVALAVYAGYFPARAFAGVVKKGVQHA
jgi:CDP-alcohol phosphatidyltransferase